MRCASKWLECYDSLITYPQNELRVLYYYQRFSFTIQVKGIIKLIKCDIKCMLHWTKVDTKNEIRKFWALQCTQLTIWCTVDSN